MACFIVSTESLSADNEEQVPHYDSHSNLHFHLM